MKNRLKPLIIGLLVLTCGGREKEITPKNVDWTDYGGNKAGTRYSPLNQINIGNVHDLDTAWMYNTGENNEGDKGMDIQCQPIVVNGIMYATTPRMKLFAVDAANGKEKWKFNPFADITEAPKFHPLRGVLYWEDGNDKRIIYSVGATLYAINAVTGEQIKTFGKDGKVDLHVGLGDKKTLGHDINNLSVRITTPGVIFKDLLIIGSSVSEGGDSAPGYIRAFNVRTGKLEWVFHTIPLPGEYGYETWSKDSYKKIGGANCWAGMVLDEKRGIVYAGTGSPSVDFYGGARHGKNLFANCLIAINARTGKRVWHFQTIHHDMWDRDLPCPPNLITVKHNGQMVEAVAQATKDGLVFVFDRDKGTPLFPVKEIPVPVTPALPGEKPWPTQPVPVKPAPFANQVLTKDDITTRTPEAHKYVLDRFINSRHGSKYTLPSTKGTLFYGFGGGAEWGGAAADPNGVLYVNANNMLWWLQMRETKAENSFSAAKGTTLFNINCAGCHGANGKGNEGAGAQAYPVLTNVAQRLSGKQISTILETGRGRMPSFAHLSVNDRKAIVDFLLAPNVKKANRAVNANDIHNSAPAVVTPKNASYPYLPPYLNNGYTQFRDQDNYPAVKPPWGTLNAIDLNTGEYLWKVTLGEYPELTKQGIPPTGTENHGGPIVTAGGLLFIAATYDEKIRAFDSRTGKIVWEYKLPTGGFATPITYMANGKQYIT